MPETSANIFLTTFSISASTFRWDSRCSAVKKILEISNFLRCDLGQQPSYFQDSSLLSHSAFWINFIKRLVFSLQIQTWGILTAQGVAILLLFKLFLSRSLYWEVSSLSATTLPLRLDSGYGSTLHNSEKRTIGIHKHIAINWCRDKCNVTKLNLSEFLSRGCRSLQTGFKHFLRLSL